MNQNFVRLDNFDGTNFMHGKDKIFFLLSTLKIAYVLDANLVILFLSLSKEEIENMTLLEFER